MTDHTPTPWMFLDGNAGNYKVIAHQNADRHDIAWTFHGVGEKEQIANARLIAAAPELLESLQNAVALWGHLSTDATQTVWVDQSRAAIAKATGK